MKRIVPGLVLLLTLAAVSARAADAPARAAFQPFNELIGSWRATGTPETGDRTKFWRETVSWGWKFKGDDAWLSVAFDKSKYFDKGSLRWLPDKKVYHLNIQTADKKTLDFEGRFDKRILTLERDGEQPGEKQRLVVTLLHETRFLYRFEVKAPNRASFTPQYKVGATREGIAFASGSSKPECIVSGGLGTMKISYKGKDYYVCCSGCRDAFKDEPEKFIKEYEEKKAKK